MSPLPIHGWREKKKTIWQAQKKTPSVCARVKEMAFRWRKDKDSLASHLTQLQGKYRQTLTAGNNYTATLPVSQSVWLPSRTEKNKGARKHKGNGVHVKHWKYMWRVQVTPRLTHKHHASHLRCTQGCNTKMKKKSTVNIRKAMANKNEESNWQYGTCTQTHFHCFQVKCVSALYLRTWNCWCVGTR